MKSVLAGTGLMVIIAVAAWLITGSQSENSSEAYSSQNNTVRLGN